MNQLPAIVLSLLLLRFFFLGLVAFSVWLVSWSARKARSSARLSWRWLALSASFVLIGLGAYSLMLLPGQNWQPFLDAARPRQPRVVFDQPGRTLFFWETTTPVTGFVRYGFSPQELNYLARPDQGGPTRLHHVAFDEPIPPTGVFLIIYSEGKKYLNPLAKPYHLLPTR